MLGRTAMTAIVTDAHYRMSVSLIRDLSDRGVRVVACEKASIKNPVGFASRGVLRCVRLPEDGYLDALLALCREILAQEGEKPALLPVGAKTLALLSEHRERFYPVAGLCIAAPTQLALLNDKAAVSSLAQKLSVPVPENFERKSGEDLDAFFARVPLPCAVKPHCGEKFGLTAAQRYRICHTKGDLTGSILSFSGAHAGRPHRAGISPGRGVRLLGSGKGRYGLSDDLPPPAPRIPCLWRAFELLREAFRGRICAIMLGKLCGKPAFPALRCLNSNAVQTARPGSWKLTPASGVRSRSRARPGRILPTAGSVWRQTFPYRKSSPQPLCAWSTIRRILPRRSVISGQESPGSFSPCCVTL